MSTNQSQSPAPSYRGVRQEAVDLTTTEAVPITVLDHKKAEEALRLRDHDARSLLDNIPGFVARISPDGILEFLNRPFLQYFGKTLDEAKKWRTNDTVHPDDLAHVIEVFGNGVSTGRPFDFEYRPRRFDGTYRWFQARWVPVRDVQGRILHWNGLVTDIDNLKSDQETLRAAEISLRQTVDTIPGFVSRLSPTCELEAANPGYLAYFGKSFDEIKNDWASVVHPNDVPHAIEIVSNAFASGNPYEVTVRVRRFDGVYRWFQCRACPLRDADGRILHWYALHMDVDDQKKAEEKLRQSEQELLTITDSIANPIAVLAPDGSMLYANRVALNESGLTMDEAKANVFFALTSHPDDVDSLRVRREQGLLGGYPFQMEIRVRQKNGGYRWKLIQYNPLKDPSGEIIRWFGTSTDIDDQKKTEERLHNENLALRDEVDRTSMFDEIVGTSNPLKLVLSRIAKVAPSDSTVLITGETGTGKELIARAIHKKSSRARRAFVSVNCAAIPRDLMASELFGHERGAFTGATQRRLGRFELADGGTIFLDEVGELQPETQVALLRVLQERELERVGGGKPIRVDVRVIAATNRDLEADVANGTFRQDLFYRLNVFPIEVPPLRERKDDLLLLVEYFVQRYGVKAGKGIHSIDKQTLELFQSYDWPGNIRELQNVIERSVILSSGDVFSIDPSWLSKRSVPRATAVNASRPAKDPTEPHSEREIIEVALAATRGRVSGPSGAAAKLGIPASTLETRIKALGINKLQFKFR